MKRDAGWYRKDTTTHPVKIYRLSKENAPKPRTTHRTYPTTQPRDDRNISDSQPAYRFNYLDLLPLQRRSVGKVIYPS